MCTVSKSCISARTFQVCLLLACLTSHNRLVYLRGGSSQTIVRAATLRIDAADQTSYLTQSPYTDTGPTSPRADSLMSGAWQGSHWSANF